MKRLFIYFFCTVAATVATMAQAPQWVISHPTSDTEYIGIGEAPLSEPDYIKKATANALADISAQIALRVEKNSLFKLVDIDGKSRNMLENNIEEKLITWLEGQELKESYNSGSTYYVCYTLNKELYAKNAEKRRQQALSTGTDYLNKGLEAEAAMNLTQAIQLYGQGLEAVAPWLFMDLTTYRNGKSINVPVELYNSCINTFAGMAITANVANVEGEMFKAIGTPIAGCLSKNGQTIPNIRLKAEFVTGGGEVSPAKETDYTGTAEFYVTNITSKEKVQELRIGIDDSFTESLTETCRQLLKNQLLPSAKITITLKNAPATAYIYASKGDLKGIEKQIGRILTNNYFTISEDPDNATFFIDVASEMEMSNIVTGGIYPLNTSYSSLTIKFYDNKSEELLLDYSVDKVKILSPTTETAEETIDTAVREIMKRVNRELPKKLKKLNLNK